MKTTLLALTAVALVLIYGATLFAVLHPRVSPAYKAAFIERTSMWEPKHYPGTPDKGMVFGQDGLPSWVQYTLGLSYRDGWGRWTDESLGNVAGLVFARDLRGTLCVDFTARAVPWVVGKTISIRAGNQTHPMQIVGGDLTRYQVQFTDLPPTDKLELVLPKGLPRVTDVPPSNGDTRRLALNLATLQITSGACSISHP